MLTTRLYKILEMYGDKIVSNLQRELRANNNIATGRALNSLKKVVYMDVAGGNAKIILNIIGERYLQAIDTGTSQKRPSSKKIEAWIRAKNNFALRDKSGRFVAKTDRNIKRAAFTIAKSIGEKGVRPHNLIEYAFGPVKNKVLGDVVTAFVEEELNNMIKNKTLKI